jgi:hypothetical protein
MSAQKEQKQGSVSIKVPGFLKKKGCPFWDSLMITYLLRDVPLLSDPLFLSLLLTDPPDFTSLSALRFCELTLVLDFRAALAVSPLSSRLETNLSEEGADDRWLVLLF